MQRCRISDRGVKDVKMVKLAMVLVSCDEIGMFTALADAGHCRRAGFRCTGTRCSRMGPEINTLGGKPDCRSRGKKIKVKP